MKKLLLFITLFVLSCSDNSNEPAKSWFEIPDDIPYKNPVVLETFEDDDDNNIIKIKVQSLENEIRLLYKMPKFVDTFYVDDDYYGETVTEIKFANAEYNTYETEKPIIPYIPIRIIIPYGKIITEVNVDFKDSTEIFIEFPLEWGSYPCASSLGCNGNTSKDSKLYASNSPYPAEQLEYLTLQYFRGMPILFMNLYPLRYIPGQNKIILYEYVKISFKMKNLPAKDIEAFQYDDDAKNWLWFVENIDDAETYNR